MTSENIIKMENIVVRRGGAKILYIAEFDVRRERILALIGPNGAGKSTVLLTMAGLLPPQQGNIIFQGLPVKTRSDLAALRRSTAVVFQEPLLLNSSVSKNIALGLKFRRFSNPEIKERAQEALDYFGINHLAARSAKTLSGGEAKRVSLARAFALKPQLILLDEPFNSLDPPASAAIIDDLQRILEETKITAVMALHNREETLRLAHDVAFIDCGNIVQSGSTAEVFNRPANEFVAGFVGTESILEGIVKTGSSEGVVMIAINGRIIEAVGRFSAGQKVYCCLRPENVTVSNEIQGKISARNVFAARVDKMIRQGFLYKLMLDCGFPLVAYVTQPSCEELGLKEGAKVVASFKATAVHLMRREK
jgi:tungstate transport system ATP-binding protein